MRFIGVPPGGRRSSIVSRTGDTKGKYEVSKECLICSILGSGDVVIGQKTSDKYYWSMRKMIHMDTSRCS